MAVDLLNAEFLRRLESLSLTAKRVHRGRNRGEHVTFRKGASLEFFDYREYKPGDDSRYVDWNLYKRTGNLFVKLFTAEEDLTVHILVDASASMAFGAPRKIDYASTLAAALGYVASAQLDRVGVATFAERLLAIHPPTGRSSITGVFSFLSAVDTSGATALSVSLAEYAARINHSGLAVIISDLQDRNGYREGLLALRQRGFEIILIHVLSEEEIEPNVDGPLRLIDSETGNTVRIFADRKLLAAYKSAMQRWFSEIEEFALTKGIEYIRASVSIPFEDLVLRYLRQGMYLH